MITRIISESLRAMELSLKHIQYAYAVYQLVQHGSRDILYLNGDQTLRSDPAVGCHVAKVRCEQQRTERLSQSSDDSEGAHLFIRIR